MENEKGRFLYQKVYHDIRIRIENGSYPSGSKLPSDEELKAAYQVSAITVKKALTMLKEEGLIQRIPGVGSFVEQKEKAAEPAAHSGKLWEAYEKEEAPASGPNREKHPKIGVILEHVSSFWGLDLLYEMDRRAAEKGYKLLVRFSYYDKEKETEEIRFLLEEGVTGLIIMPCHGLYYNPNLLKLILNGFPVVVIDKKLDGIPVPSVRTDNEEAVYRLMHELYGQGCRSFGFITNQVEGTSSLMERRRGFWRAAGELKCSEASECLIEYERLVLDHRPSDENISLICDYLKQKPGMDAVICAEYGILPALESAAERMGRGLGQDLKAACMDGTANLKYLHMQQDEAGIAAKAVELVLKQDDRGNERRTEQEPAEGQEVAEGQEADSLFPAVMIRGRES